MKLFKWSVFIIILTGCSGEHMPISDVTEEKKNEVLAKGLTPAFETDVLALFQRVCSGCHNATSPQPQSNLLSYDVAFAKKDAIYNRIVVKKDMPRPPAKLTDAERSLIEKWILAGAPEKSSAASKTPTVPVETPAPSDGQRSDRKKTPEEWVAFGKGLYQKYGCVTCHGAAGDGKMTEEQLKALEGIKPRSFLGDEPFKKGNSVEQIAQTILEGVATDKKKKIIATDEEGDEKEVEISIPAQMPAFGSLSLEERTALAHYIRSLNKKVEIKSKDSEDKKFKKIKKD